MRVASQERSGASAQLRPLDASERSLGNSSCSDGSYSLGAQAGGTWAGGELCSPCREATSPGGMQPSPADNVGCFFLAAGKASPSERHH